MKRMQTVGVVLTLIYLLSVTLVAAGEIEDLQAAIDAAGAHWTAGETSMSHLGREEFAHYCNMEIKIPENWQQYRFDMEIPKDMPPHLDWRDIDGQDFTTPIKDQHPCGSCATFSSVGTFEALIKIALGNPFIIPDLSEQHIFSCAGPVPYQFFTPLAVMKNEGASDEACFPYQCDAPGQRPPCDAKCPDYANRSFRTDGYQMMMYPSVEQMKAALQDGPIVSGFQVYEDFRYYAGGVYEHVSGGIVGGHGVSVVGYDDPGQYWICKNSWGTEWGEDGWFRIKYGEGGLMPFGYQSFDVRASAATLCADKLPPTISALAILNESPVLLESEDLLITFAYEDLNADLAGGELWYSIDGAPHVRYEEPLTGFTGTAWDGMEEILFVIPAPFGPGEHVISVHVNDLCGLSSNELLANFTVEGEVDGDADDDDSSSDAGFAGCGC